MARIEHETETETDTDYRDEFTPLFAIRGRRRSQLFKPENMALLVRLKTADMARYVKLIDTLTANGVPKVRELEAAVDKKAREIERRLRQKGGGGGEADMSPLALARRFKDEVHPTLIWYQSDWLLYRVCAYDVLEPDLVRRDLYQFLEDQGGAPDARAVSNLLDALKGVCLAERGTYEPPCWLDDEGRPAPKEVLACRNGLLHLPSARLMDPTPDFFTRNGLPYDFDPSAAEPTNWLGFLDDLWRDDPEQITLLQEVMGYLLIPDTSRQKFFMFLGPPRSGKGTITRIVTMLLGKASICSPTLSQLGSRFGLETTLGKTLATVSDMRLGKGADRQDIVGNLLRIVGEDDVDVERKFVGGALTVRLPLRILISTNLVPVLPDVSGALTARLIAFKFTESFLDREDLDLDAKLTAELPSILNWAIDGWRRLQEQGRFSTTRASREVAHEMADMASPLNAFIRECCELDPEGVEPKEKVWRRYQGFVVQEHLPETYGSADRFHRDLVAATMRRITTYRPRGDGDRPRCWKGLRLLPLEAGSEAEKDEWSTWST